MKSRDEETTVWTLPNRLSFVRILVIPVIVYLISTEQEQFLFASSILFILAGITDGLDGYIARRMSLKSRLGLYLDPIADKLLVSSVLITLSYYRLFPSELQNQVFLWLTVVLVSREFLINGLRSFYAREGVTIYPSFSGKLKTTLQIIGISCILFHDGWIRQLGFGVTCVALIFSLYSAFNYVSALFTSE
jgi:CDP-diacylglycerol---glycerol-3-phosphate 3-phosphatidyltransferase